MTTFSYLHFSFTTRHFVTFHFKTKSGLSIFIKVLSNFFVSMVGKLHLFMFSWLKCLGSGIILVTLLYGSPYNIWTYYVHIYVCVVVNINNNKDTHLSLFDRVIYIFFPKCSCNQCRYFCTYSNICKDLTCTHLYLCQKSHDLFTIFSIDFCLENMLVQSSSDTSI